MRRFLLTSVVVAVAVTMTGCSAQQEDVAAPTPSASATATPSDDPSPSATASRPPDPTVTGVPTAERSDALPAGQRVTAPAASFAQALRYRDGVQVRVTSVAQGKSTGVGPGEFANSPRTTIKLTVTNGSDAALDLSQVVVSTLYGKPTRQAQPVYDEGATDLSGTLAPGKSASATYMFSVPQEGLDAVRTVVDLDGRHAPGTFSGSM